MSSARCSRWPDPGSRLLAGIEELTGAGMPVLQEGQGSERLWGQAGVGALSGCQAYHLAWRWRQCRGGPGPQPGGMALPKAAAIWCDLRGRAALDDFQDSRNACTEYGFTLGFHPRDRAVGPVRLSGPSDFRWRQEPRRQEQCRGAVPPVGQRKMHCWKWSRRRRAGMSRR